MPNPSYVVNRVVDASLQLKNVVVLDPGLPRQYVEYDPLTTTQKADLDLVVQASGGVVPLRNMIYLDTVVVSTGKTWRQEYGPTLLKLSHTYLDNTVLNYTPATGGAALSSATPQPLGSATAGATGVASDAGHVHAIPSAAQLNVMGLPLSWNASTNTPTLASGTVGPTDNVYTVTVAGTTTLDGISSWNVGDMLYFNGVWNRISASSIGISTTSLLKGDGAGNVVAAVSGTDYQPTTLYQMAVPIGVTGGGTVTSNGAVTMTTAFLTTYSDGIWLYYPANAITGSNAAGFYWTVMSSTTAGTIYQNTFAAFTNTTASMAIPASPTAFSGTTGQAFTGSISTGLYAPNITVPGGMIGKNGSVTTRLGSRYNNSATNKGCTMFFDPTTGNLSVNNCNGTTASYTAQSTTMYNRGRVDRQIVPANNDTVAFTYNLASIDTSTSKSFQVRFFMAGATDWCVCEFAQVIVRPGL